MDLEFEGVGVRLEYDGTFRGKKCFRVTKIVRGQEMAPGLTRTPWWCAQTPEDARKVLDWMDTLK